MLVQIQIVQPNSLKIQALNLRRLPDATSYAYDKSKFLTKSCGRLFTLEIVYTNRSFRDIVGIEIHRFDFAKKVWLKIKSAKDRAFFLSFNNKYNHGHRCVFSCPITEIEGNCVYFTLADDHKELYSYNIEERIISVSPPFLWYCHHGNPLRFGWCLISGNIIQYRIFASSFLSLMFFIRNTK